MPAEPPRPSLAAPPAAPSAPSSGGELLAGRYRLGGPLGSGGTAEVFRATDLRLRRPVAIKRFRPGAGVIGEDEFCEEAVLLARLQHPGLVTVYDAGRDDHGAYLVMDLIDGITLRDRITAGPIPYDHVLRLGRRLASALAHVHAAGIVHRDVKPSNVLLNSGGEPFLADFGLSRPSDYPSRAEPGTVLGTAAYMAPEQVLGKGSVPASDVYALGLVLLECLKGEKEYLGAPPEAGVARLLRPPDMTVGIPETLVPVVKAMTRRDPRARPDAAQCALLLRAVADAGPRHPQPIAGLGVGLGIGVGTGPGTETATGTDDAGTEPDTHGPPTLAALPPAEPDPADAADPADPAPRARNRRTLAAAGAALAAAVLGTTGGVLALAAHGDRSTPGAVHDGRSPTTTAAPAAAASPGVQSTPAAAPARPSVQDRTTTAGPIAVTAGEIADGTADQPGPEHGNRHGKGSDSGKGKGQGGREGPGTSDG